MHNQPPQTLELNQIYNIDCLKGMPLIPDNSIDLCITSPPYNLGNTHHTGNRRHIPYTDNLPENIYQNQQIEVLLHIHRILKPDGSLFYNHKNRIKAGESISPYRWIFQTRYVKLIKLYKIIIKVYVYFLVQRIRFRRTYFRLV